MEINGHIKDQVQTLNDQHKDLNLDYELQIISKSETRHVKRIIVYHGKSVIPVKVGNINVVFTDNNYRFIQTHDEQYSCPYTLESMEQMFGSLFFRVNRQYLISFGAIDQIFVEDASKLSVRLKKPFNIVMQISRRRTSQFIQWLEFNG